MFNSVIKTALALAVLPGVLALLQTAPAHAQTLMWVANYGSDTATCGDITAPCRSLQQAHDHTNPGGAIRVLTPGDYSGGFGGSSRLTITRTIHISNDGVGEADIFVGALVGDRDGITINAGRGDVVSLRGLVIHGYLDAQNGIVAGQQVSALHIQNCVIRNFLGDGIIYSPSTSSQLFVSDTVIFNNGSIAVTGGILIAAFAINTNVVFDRVHLENNLIGLRVNGGGGTGNGAHVVIRDSVVSGNAVDGIQVLALPDKAPAFVVVEHTSVLNNTGAGILASGPHAVVLLNDNTITRNGTGISATNGGQLISYGNNKNNNNVGPEGAPTGLFSQM